MTADEILTNSVENSPEKASAEYIHNEEADNNLLAQLGEVSTLDENDNSAEVLPTNMEIPDYSHLSKEQLAEEIHVLIHNRDIYEIRDNIEAIKTVFYKKHHAEMALKKNQFIDDGGDIKDFQPNADETETKFKELYRKYKEEKAKYHLQIEQNKQANYAKKLEIIEEIKQLASSSESLNKTYEEFRELQARWRNVGPVPQTELKNLWETYNLYVEKFYDYISVNKELRDLDLKKNLEAKVHLCESAEELLMEDNIVIAYNKLQDLHDKWKDIGPVAKEFKEEVWLRFKDVTTKINKKHQDYFLEQKEILKKNLEQRLIICDKAEELIAKANTNAKEWQEHTEELKQIIEEWKNAGQIARREGQAVLKRFHYACESFFQRKKDFFSEHKDRLLSNLQLKVELCVQAESYTAVEDWEKTTRDLLQLQKDWREIGPVPKNQSDKIWKRFRAACDSFFEKKSAHYQAQELKYEGNLQLKNALIIELEEIINANTALTLDQLKDYQRRWMEIGFVPMKSKKALQENYKNIIDKLFNRLQGDRKQIDRARFSSKIEELKAGNKSGDKIYMEKEKLNTRIKALKEELALLENNIGFFGKSKNANSLIEGYQKQIDQKKIEIKSIQEKIIFINKS